MDSTKMSETKQCSYFYPPLLNLNSARDIKKYNRLSKGKIPFNAGQSDRMRLEKWQKRDSNPLKRSEAFSKVLTISGKLNKEINKVKVEKIRWFEKVQPLRHEGTKKGIWCINFCQKERDPLLNQRSNFESEIASWLWFELSILMWVCNNMKGSAGWNLRPR